VHSGEDLGSVLLDKLEDLFVDPVHTRSPLRPGQGSGPTSFGVGRKKTL